MKTKNIKTPLVTAESDAPSYWPVTIVPERKRSHMATAHYGFILKLSRHEWQKHKKTFKSLCVIQWKQFAQLPLSCTTEKFFIVFASDDVFSCKATGDDGRACVCELVHRHKAMTAARKLEERKQQQRSFEGFCKHPKLEQ